MKKHLILALAAVTLVASAASAQANVVKEAERALKSGKSPEEVVAIITPAFTNEETKNDAMTYLIPGKAYFNQYEDLTKKQVFGKGFPEDGNKIMAKDLINGYDYYMKALAVDTVVNAKGKVEHKKSKEILNTIIGSAPYFYQKAGEMYQIQDYDDTYRLFEIYNNIYDKEPFKSEKKADPTYSVAETYYNMGIAAWQGENLPNALKAFTNARNAGYSEKQLYDYALNLANNLNDKEAIADWATKGNELFGSEDPLYLGNIINLYLQDEQFDKAFSAIDQAIAVDPNNAQYYFIKGVLYDNDGKPAEAKAMFKKCIELNPENVDGLTQYGRSLFMEGLAINDNAPANISVADSQKLFNDSIRPLFQEAITYLEKAYELNNDNTDALKILENIYYNLGDDTKYQEVRSKLGYND